jgi:hypothetical protein
MYGAQSQGKTMIIPDLFMTSNRPARLRAPCASSSRLDDAPEASPPAAFLAQSVESFAEGFGAGDVHRRLESWIGGMIDSSS